MVSVRDYTGGERRNHRTAPGYVFKNLADTAATEVSASVAYDAGAQGSSVLFVAMDVSGGRKKEPCAEQGPLPGGTKLEEPRDKFKPLVTVLKEVSHESEQANKTVSPQDVQVGGRCERGVRSPQFTVLRPAKPVLGQPCPHSLGRREVRPLAVDW